MGNVLLWFLTGITIIIALYLSLIYIRIRRSFHKIKDEEIKIIRAYPCYLNIIISSIIAINNIFRLIKFKEVNFPCHVQALILAIFDKLVYTTITLNAFLTYKGLSDNESYMNNIKKLFLITNGISITIAVLFGIIFFCAGSTILYDNVCYIEASIGKESVDTIIMFILYFIFIYSNIKSILFLLNNMKELVSTYNKNNLSAYLFHFYRIIVSLFLSSLAFLVTILIINNSLFVGDSDNNIDALYIFICLINDLFYTLNLTVFKETKKLLCCKEEEKYAIETEIDDDDNDEKNNVRTLSDWNNDED